MSSRSQSRGREQMFSSGRGGAGNIKPASKSREPREKGPDDFSPSRGRELRGIIDHITHAGRGGAGNIRSPSRDADGERKYVAEVEQHARDSIDPNAPRSSGRGGAGNISRSRSRSKEPKIVAPVHTSGRGGAGNIAPGAHEGHLTTVEESEVRQHHQEGGLHSTGRGGAANVTEFATPPLSEESRDIHDHHHGGEHFSSGRGGAGNIH